MTRYIDYFRKRYYKMDWLYDKHVEWQRNWKKQTIVKKLVSRRFYKQSIGVLMRLCVFFKSFFFIKLGKKAKLV